MERYQCEIFVEESELVALEAREGLADVAADPGKVRLVAVERQHLLVRHDPRTIPFKVGEFQNNKTYLFKAKFQFLWKEWLGLY